MAGTNGKIAGGGFHHVCMRVKDLHTSIKFYTEGLGFVEKASWRPNPTRCVLLDAGDGNYFEIAQGDPHKTQEAGLFQHIALRTDNCDAATDAARTAGAEITVEPKDVILPNDPPLQVRVSFCKGPDDEVIEFFQNNQT